MAFHLGALVTSLIFLVAFHIPHDVHANNYSKRFRTKRVGHLASRVRSKFVAGPWKQAHATFYEGSPTTFGGACGYEDVTKHGYGQDTAALSQALFNQGKTCGACFEIKCNQPQWCKKGKQSLIVTATDHCPPNPYQSSDNGGWCNPPREHFDLAKPAYLKIAEYKAGIVPIHYRRVPCKRQGGIKFTITGNPYFYLVSVSNVGGAGVVVGVQVKGDKTKWTSLSRNWGQKWQTNVKLQGQALTFRVKTSDGGSIVSSNIFPKNWQFSQTYVGRNFV
ncbi:hypothetical protein RIF29_39888 [Crotalaria pallida]|uniref:Expansin n=1 Tax=Crotalaria pallida TaxID=3830 RepID=A0AAN9HR49_CROPI